MKNIRLCPVCRAPIAKPLKEKLGLTLKIQLLILTVACSGAVYIFRGFEPAVKSSLVYLVFLAVAELLHWVKMRQNVQCEVCHFDPILYKRDWKKARSIVETRMQGAFSKASLQIKDTLEFHDALRSPSVNEVNQSAVAATGGEKQLEALREVRSGSVKSLSSLK